jgi:hypothetical protein
MSKILLSSLLLILTISLLSMSVVGVQILKTTIAQRNKNFLIYDNSQFRIRLQYPSGWGKLDLSFLEDNNGADIQFYPLNDTSIVKNVI